MRVRSLVSSATLVWGAIVLWVVNALAFASAGVTPWWHAAGAGLGNAFQLGSVALGAWWMASRLPYPGAYGDGCAGRARLAAYHAIAATALTALAIAQSVLGRHLPHGPGEHHSAVPGPALGWLASWFLFLYAAVAAATYVAHARTELRARELETVRAELRALRAQLDPHFLFNALHSVGVLVRADPAAAEEAVERLGDLLRYVLRAGRPAGAHVEVEGDVAVPLDAELAFVADYLAVERIRFGDRLRVEEAIAPATRCALVPALVLQPLVENAVKYAVGPRREGATVRVVAERGELPNGRPALRLGVLDDGPGPRPSHADRTALHGAGLGLTGLRRRLEAWYPDAYRLELDAPAAGGFRVWLSLPWQPSVEEA